MIDLSRFKEAQRSTHEYALQELRQGLKRTHWMWWEFPQLKGLGYSYNSQFYGLTKEEAEAYSKDCDLMCNMLSLVDAIERAHCENDLLRVFQNPVDVDKFHACMTLFAFLDPGGFCSDALDVCFGGERHQKTLELLME